MNKKKSKLRPVVCCALYWQNYNQESHFLDGQNVFTHALMKVLEPDMMRTNGLLYLLTASHLCCSSGDLDAS